MELEYSNEVALVHEIFSLIKNAILQLQEWNADVEIKSEQFLSISHC